MTRVSQYVIIDAIPRMALKDLWSQRTDFQHTESIGAMGTTPKHLCNLEFAAFG